MNEVNAILAISHRDVMKFLRDRPRIVTTFIFPLILIGVLGGSMQASLGAGLGFNFLAYTFTGVLSQTLFQSAAFGVISLIEDRQNDFSQEIFISPISRYSIVFGKILGESLVALVQGIGIVLFALAIGISFSIPQIIGLLPVSIATCLLGGAFGVIILSNLNNAQSAQNIFPVLMLPQYFLAGVFNPIQILPLPLEILSRISPLRYAVDLTRNAFYVGSAEYQQVVLAGPVFNLVVMSAFFGVFLFIGTLIFVRREQNR